MNRFASLAAAALVAVLAPAAAASARSKTLWATVNVCDTKAHPNRMGVRARMPGDGTRERMYMRFTAQFRRAGAWHVVEGKGVSKWLYAGSALFRTEELGYTFSFDPPPAGSSYLMRGLVRFEWRKHSGTRWRVVHRAHAYTAPGHPSRGADPKGFSAAICRIRPDS